MRLSAGAVWYRMTDFRTAPPYNEDGDATGRSTPNLRVEQFPVIRFTPKGAWLDVYGAERFVRREARKRFACPTLEEAKESLRARKKRQLSLLEAQARSTREILDMLERA